MQNWLENRQAHEELAVEGKSSRLKVDLAKLLEDIEESVVGKTKRPWMNKWPKEEEEEEQR